ncbi:MAG: DUF397 domain-containing protein [Kineosporiaceae bacterium]|nr:DUF397 domain-containing protein [Kineosporiaceae bacterium]
MPGAAGSHTAVGRIRLSPDSPALGSAWRQSSFCSMGNCVRVRREGDDVIVGDSKDPHGPQLRYTSDEWVAFVAGIKAAEFDL